VSEGENHRQHVPTTVFPTSHEVKNALAVVP